MTKALKTFRFLAIAEGISYLLFAITMPLKYQMDILWPNKIVGNAHGLLFLLYVVFLLVVTFQQKWGIIKFGLGFIASLVPFGTFVFERKVLK